MGFVAQRSKAGDVICVQMCVDRFDELQIELADELKIAINLFENRIDDQGFPASAACQKI